MNLITKNHMTPAQKRKARRQAIKVLDAARTEVRDRLYNSLSEDMQEAIIDSLDRIVDDYDVSMQNAHEQAEEEVSFKLLALVEKYGYDVIMAAYQAGANDILIVPGSTDLTQVAYSFAQNGIHNIDGSDASTIETQAAELAEAAVTNGWGGIGFPEEAETIN